ncbi:MAG TPA: hypothetical protein DDZ91_07640 [Firmicutes bacterium]|nr:hypothetical protein [Bacillota bacterium]
MYKRLSVGFNRFIDTLCVIVQLIMVLTVVLQVFYRYVLVNPLGWTEEVGIMTMVWSTFIGSYLAFREDKHMRISLLYNKLSEKSQKAMLVLGNVLMVVMNIYIIIYGSNFVRAFHGMNSPYIGIPMSLVYAIIPVSAVLWSAKLILDSFAMIKSQDKMVNQEGKGGKSN